MAPVKILILLFSIVNIGQVIMMFGGGIEKPRLSELLSIFHIEVDAFPGFTISITTFILLILALFAFFMHFINYKEHYSAFFRFLILANFFIAFIAVIFNFYLYFLKG
jgi:hypothetical protein